jgi:tetratricopeptide (TPR) repeat protein
MFCVACFVCLQAHAQTPDSAVRYYQDGLKKIKKGNWPGAVEDYTKAIEISSHFNPAQQAAARQWNSENPFGDLQSDAREIRVIDPFTAYAYTDRAIAYFHMGDFDAAIADCDRALRIKPGLAAAYLSRGAAHNAKGDRDGAMLDYNRALAIDDHFFEAYHNRAALRQDLGDNDGAIDDINHAIQINPKIPQAYYIRGYVLQEKKDVPGAINDFNRAIELNPAFASAYQGRGICQMR